MSIHINKMASNQNVNNPSPSINNGGNTSKKPDQDTAEADAIEKAKVEHMKLQH